MQREKQSSSSSSYPPEFRQQETPIAPESAIIPSIELPVLDLTDPIKFPAKLVDVCSSWGIFRLINHGISASLIDDLHWAAARFLSLPFEIKKSQSSPSLTYFWGTPAVSINLKKINWIEGLHLPLGNLYSSLGTSSSSLRDLAEELGKEAEILARKILETLAIELGDFGSKLVRLHRYPLSPEGCDEIGMDAHTDSSLLTLVSDGDIRGLEIFRDGAWFTVDPLPGSLLVNIGDMTQAISDDRYVSVKHRVVARGAEERRSVCFFVFPGEDFPIRSSRYREFTYREFKAMVEEDVRSLGFKVGLPRFRKMRSNVDSDSDSNTELR